MPEKLITLSRRGITASANTGTLQDESKKIDQLLRKFTSSDSPSSERFGKDNFTPRTCPPVLPSSEVTSAITVFTWKVWRRVITGTTGYQVSGILHSDVDFGIIPSASFCIDLPFLSHVRNASYQLPLMDMQTKCTNSTSGPMCYEEASGPLAMIIIPSLLALSTVLVVTVIFCSLYRRKRTQQRNSAAAHYTNGQQSVSLGAASISPVRVQECLRPWEIPGECVLQGLEYWQTGRYGPICNGLLKRDGASTAVLVKSLRESSNHPEAKEFVDWVLFHATVCKHENLVRMLCCRTKRMPMYLVLEAYSPGNLLHFLWTLRNRDSDTGDPSQHFSERSVFLVAKQVATGLDYLMSEHRLVHGDVAARNILIGPGLSARVSGLGVAFAGRQMDSAISQRAAEVPLKWQAPERIMKQPMIDRSDVWSFGIFLYEMITLGSPPYPELEPQSVLQQLQKSYRMKRPENCGGPLYDLMKYCWMWSFKDRPAFSAIIKLLESYLYLAATTALCTPEVIDIVDYEKKAGL